MAFDTRFLRSCISSSTKSLNDGLYQQNQQVSFRFPEIASWRVGGGSFQIDSSQPVKLSQPASSIVRSLVHSRLTRRSL